MAQFTGSNGSFTPAAHATNANNIAVNADTAGDMGKIVQIGWGGRGTTSTGYRTRWGRATTNGSTTTSLNALSSNPSATPLCFCGTYGTPAVLGADPIALFAIDWNVLGGGGTIILPLAGGWVMVGNAAPYSTIACGNIAGVDASQSSYMSVWEE